MSAFKRELVSAGLASVFIILLAVITQVAEFPLLFASLASSVIIVFSNPEGKSARPKVVVGSHLLAAFIGLGAVWLLPQSLIVAAGISFFVLMFLIIHLDIFHPPAGGTVLSFVVYHHPVEALIGLAGGTILLALLTLGDKRSLVSQFLLYFYGTPFYKDSPIQTLTEIEQILEREAKILELHPLIGGKTRKLRLQRKEKVRKLMFLVFRDEFRDHPAEEELITQIEGLDKDLGHREDSKIAAMDKRLDEAMKKLHQFIAEFAED